MRHVTPFTSESEIAAIGNGLIDRSLPRPAWTHEAHFAAALWLLSRHPHPVVAEIMPGLIRAYNVSVGCENTETSGYHETITQASIRAASACLAAAGAAPLLEVCNALLASALGQPDWLLAYWSRSRLFSPEARGAWVAPDIEDLPF